MKPRVLLLAGAGLAAVGLGHILATMGMGDPAVVLNPDGSYVVDPDAPPKGFHWEAFTDRLGGGLAFGVWDSWAVAGGVLLAGAGAVQAARA